MNTITAINTNVQDDAGDIHGVSQPTVSRICAKVARAIARHANQYIKMPSTIEEQERVSHAFNRIKSFPGVVVVIDCTHIKIKKQEVVCDANLKIMDIVARWRGSTHDSRIFNESQIKQRFEDGVFRGRLLVDSGYPLLPYLLTPVLNPTQPAELRYNEAHIATRNTVERCFGVWKQRFQCLLYGLPDSLANTKIVIIALAVLHNIAIDMNDNLIDEHIEPLQYHSTNNENSEASAPGSQRRSQFIAS